MDVLNQRWRRRAQQIAALEAQDFLSRYRGLVATLPELADDLQHRHKRIEQARVALRLRFRHKRGEFLRYVLPGIFNRPWNPYHRAVLGRPKQHWKEQVEVERRQNLAPRGVGKSTIKKGDVAHSVCYGLRRFIIIVAATQKHSKNWANTLKAWFTKRTEKNARLWELYGPFTLGGGADRFTITNRWGDKTTLLCASVNTSLQGEEEETHRPDEVILDDWEDRKKVKNAAIRADWQRKLNEEILKLRAQDRGAVFENNCTVNHPDAISQRIRERKAPNLGWVVDEFPAILSWPVRKDLWEKCQGIYLNLSLGDEVRKRAARAFYKAHQAEMDKGAAVLDPVATPLFALYEMIWCEGLAAFLREMQHQVRGLGDAIFDSSRFTRCTVETHPVHGFVIVNGATGSRIPISEMKKRVGRWDPCTGAPGGDYAAIAILLRDKAGYGYLVECWMEQAASITDQCAAAWRLAEKWGLSKISLESNGFQRVIDEFFKPERRRRQASNLFWRLTLTLSPSSTNKEERISGLEPVLHAAVLQLAADIEPALVSQLDDFDADPKTGHDDGPDAVEGAWARSGGIPPGMRNHDLSRDNVAARHAA